MRYVRAWEEARREQNALRYELEIRELSRTLDNCYIRERNENRVNSELIRYLTWRIAVREHFFFVFNFSISFCSQNVVQVLDGSRTLKSTINF